MESLLRAEERVRELLKRLYDTSVELSKDERWEIAEYLETALTIQMKEPYVQRRSKTCHEDGLFWQGDNLTIPKRMCFYRIGEQYKDVVKWSKLHCNDISVVNGALTLHRTQPVTLGHRDEHYQAFAKAPANREQNVLIRVTKATDPLD